MAGENFAPEGAAESPVATKYKVTHILIAAMVNCCLWMWMMRITLPF